jgi:hypothetical protein
MRPVAGSVLFTLGIIIAISGAAKPPASGATFPDTIPVFIAGILAAVAGIEIWWGHRSILRLLAGDGDSDSPDNPFVILSQLIPAIKELESRIDDMAPAEIESAIDDVASNFVTPFVEGRQTLIDQLGLKAGANLLVTSATGERLLNRTWSAAADGHLVEARSSFREAAQAFDEAAAMVPDASSSV